MRKSRKVTETGDSDLSKSLHVLIITKSEKIAGPLIKALGEEWRPLLSKRVGDELALRAALHAEHWDCVVCDMAVAGFTAPAVLELLKQSEFYLPFVLISAGENFEDAAHLLTDGAHGFVRMRDVAQIVPMVKLAIKLVDNSQRRKVAESRLQMSELRFRGLFEHSEVSIWNDDFSEVYKALARLRSEGVTTLRAYLEADNNLAAFELATMINVLDVNPASLKLFGVTTAEELLANANKIFGHGWAAVFIDGFCALWDKHSSFRTSVNFKTVDGRPIHAVISLPIPTTLNTSRSVPVTITDITQQKLAEQRLQEYKHIVSGSNDMLALLDRDSNFMAVNTAFAAAAGKSTEQFIGHSALEMYGWKKFNTGMKPHIESCLQGNEASDQMWFDLPVGGKVYLDIHYTPHYGPDHAVVGFVVAARDITPLQQTREALEYLNSSLSVLSGTKFFEALVTYIARTLGMAHVFVSTINVTSDKASVLAGVSSDKSTDLPLEYALVGTPCEDVVHGGLCCWTSGVQEQFPDDDMLAEWGVESYVGMSLRDTLGRVVGLINAMDTRPIENPELKENLIKLFASRAASEIHRGQNEQMLRESEEKFRTLTELSPVGVIFSDAGGKINYVNPRFLEIAGLSRDQAVGSGWQQAIHPNDKEQVISQWVKAVANNQEFSQEYRWCHADGTVRWASETIQPVEDPNGCGVADSSAP